MKSSSLFDLETPCVIVDYRKLIDNIKFMQDIADKNSVFLRPHVKTHKCVQIAKLQIKEGAVGITASKTDEAIVFIEGGIQSITVAYPILQKEKLDRLFVSAVKNNTNIRMVVDSIEGIRNISTVCDKYGVKIPVFVEIDVGLHRCGLSENDPAIIDLVNSICDDRNISFAGLFSHAGHAYAAKNADDIRQIASKECNIMWNLRQKIQDKGHKIAEVSVGATPTALVSNAYSGITEIRPGNYVFFDMTSVRKELISAEKISLSIVATVVSKNDSYYIVDAGSKTLSSDMGAHGTVGPGTYGQAYKLEDYENTSASMPIVKLSEEHGFIQRNGMDLKIGEKVKIFPNHSCPVANLAEYFLITDNYKVLDRWNVDARGHVL